MIGVSCGMSLLSSTGHLPTLALPLSLSGADGGCSSLPRVVVTGGTWGLQLVLAEHPAHVSSLGAHGSMARITLPPHWSWCTVSRIGGGATLPPHCCGWDRMRLATHIGGAHPDGGIVMAVIRVARIVVVAWVTCSSWLG